MMKMQGNTTEIDERNLLRLDALLSHGYGLSPQLVMRSKGLSIEAKALYGYLSSFAGAGDTAFPSTSRILEELDIIASVCNLVDFRLDGDRVLRQRVDSP